MMKLRSHHLPLLGILGLFLPDSAPGMGLNTAPPSIRLRSSAERAEALESVTLESRSGGSSRLLRPGEIAAFGVTLRGAASSESRATRILREGELVVPGVFAAGETLETKRIGVLRKGAIPMPDGGVLPTEGYVLGLRQEGADLIVPALLPGSGKTGVQEYVVVDHSRSEEWTQPAILEPDPRDPEPLGARSPVILIHGKDDPDPNSAYKTEIWKALRDDSTYPSLFRSYKFYIYRYPTYHATRESGRILKETIAEVIGLDAIAERSMVIIAHSQGGLVARWAMNTDGFGEKVRLLVTGTTPHHGSGAGSLVYANGAISAKVGWFWSTILRFAQSNEPDNPGLRSLGWDNFDGAISAEDQEVRGVFVNEELRWLNTHDAYADRLICVMGDVNGLIGHGPYALIYEFIRRGLATYHAPWGSSDPVVSLASGTCAGSAIQDRVTFPGRDHDQLLRDPEVADYLRQLLGFRALEGSALLDFP